MRTGQIILKAATASTLSLMLLFAGCTKPPVDEVAALQSDLASCKDQGAEVFAEAEFAQVSQKMATLQGYMDGKQNRLAKALADSMAADMEALKSATAANAMEMATQAVASVNEELARLKGLLTPEASKLLGEEETGKCQQQLMELDNMAAALAGNLENSAYLEAYNNAKPMASQIAMSSQEMGQKIEQAMAMEAEKKAKKPARKK